MPMRLSIRPLGAVSAMLAVAALPAHADSGVGVDTWLGNKLDPTGGTFTQIPDDRGTTWLVAGQRRTPTGNLLSCPVEPPVFDTLGDWLVRGQLQIGGTVTSGDDDNKLWRRYVDWGNRVVPGLEVQAERPEDGSYVDVRASRLSDDDQYYDAVFGRAGSYKIEAFMRDLPNVVSSNAKPIWNGVGSDQLTLSGGLVPGASTPAQVAAVSAATPERTLSVQREKIGAGSSVYLTPEWSAYGNVTDEKRSGTRPFGGSFFFNYPAPGDGGILETVKPINDQTLNLNGGLRYVADVWRLDLGYSGSFYRDGRTRFTFETPYPLYPLGLPDAVSAPLTTGQYSTEPDNDYHNLRATVTRTIPLDGEVSLTGSVGRMSQNDTLIAPVDCNGVFGVGLNGSLQLGPQNPYLFDCANWNTRNALSRNSADMRIDTTLVDGRIVLRPAPDVSVRGSVRFNREDYSNTYVALNPLTGQYGYVSENGSQGSVVAGDEVGFFDPQIDPTAVTRVRNLPLDKQTTDVEGGVDWRVSARNTLGVTYAFNRYEPNNRERGQIDDNSIKLTWVNRTRNWLTLRVNYTYLIQTGNQYHYDPYGFTYSSSLPGYTPPPTGTPSNTVDALRKYDMSSRDQNKLDVMATFIPRSDMTFSASLRGDWNDYDAQIGRQKSDTYNATLQWEWQPLPATNVSLYAAWDRTRLGLSNVQDQQNGVGTDPTLGGTNYAFEGQWWLQDTQRDYYAGATFTHTARGIRFDAGWNYTYARGTDNYSYAGSSALTYPDTVSGAGPGSGSFPANTYRVNAFTGGVTFPLAKQVSLRIFDYYERGRVSDWHYAGFDSSRVYDHRVYTDGGPTNYSANVVGMFLNIKL